MMPPASVASPRTWEKARDSEEDGAALPPQPPTITLADVQPGMRDRYGYTTQDTSLGGGLK